MPDALVINAHCHSVFSSGTLSRSLADSKSQLREHKSRLEVNFLLFYGLTLEQMQDLGLCVSIPRSEQETDQNLAEPG